MRKILSVAFLGMILLVFGQQNINFQDLSFKDLLAKAKKEKKILFIDAYASWCGPCKMMEKNVFTTKSVSDYYNTNFVNAHFDMEKGEGREIASKFGIRSYPTYLFLNGEGELVYQSAGYMGETEFVEVGKQANNPNNKKGSLKDRFAKGEKDAEFLINIMKLNAQSDFEFAKKASERYFENKKFTETFTQDEVSFLLYFLKSDTDKNYKVFKDKKDDIIKLIPEQTYISFDNELKLGKLINDVINSKNSKIDDDYFMNNATPLIGAEEAKKRLDHLKLSFYEQTSNFPEYEKVALEYFKNPDVMDQNEVLKAAWIFSDNVKNVKSLKTATEWTEKIVMRGETSENTYVLAKLYAQLGQKDLAKNFAELSKGIAEKTGKDSTLATQLLQKLK